MYGPQWNNHYKSEKSQLSYPDENLVRLIKKNMPPDSLGDKTAVDLGCGSGRHVKLLNDLGFNYVIGMDFSFNALSISLRDNRAHYIQCDNMHIPLKTRSIDAVIAWGSLHYNHKDDLPGMLDEIRFILKDGGYFLGTIRSTRDTHLKKGTELGNNVWKTDLKDIGGSIVSFYSEDEIKEHFSIFSHLEYGIIERSVVGDINSIISHWVITAKK